MTRSAFDSGECYFSNKLGRIFILSLEEILGKTCLNDLMRSAELNAIIDQIPPDNFDREFSSKYIARLYTALQKLYGSNAGYGLALRAGRISFKYWLRELGPILGISNLSFRLLPLNMKIKSSFLAFTDLINHCSDQIVFFEQKPDAYYWHTTRSPSYWGQNGDCAYCYFTIGSLQEAMFWISGGKNFQVEEITNIPQEKQVCTIRIDRKPIN